MRLLFKLPVAWFSSTRGCYHAASLITCITKRKRGNSGATTRMQIHSSAIQTIVSILHIFSTRKRLRSNVCRAVCTCYKSSHGVLPNHDLRQKYIFSPNNSFAVTLVCPRLFPIPRYRRRHVCRDASTARGSAPVFASNRRDGGPRAFCSFARDVLQLRKCVYGAGNAGLDKVGAL